MDPELFQTLGNCVSMVDDLIRDMEKNREFIGSCVGQEAAEIYRSMCDGVENTLHAVRHDLRLLQHSTCIKLQCQ